MSIEHPFATLLRLQGRRPDEVIPICTIDPGVKGLNTHWATVTEAPEVADRFAGVSNVFYGIQPTSRPESGRGTSQSVTGLVALFCDLDFSDGKTEGAGIDRLDALDFIDELAGAIGAEPHCVVSTGGGLHPYWMVADDSGDRLDPIDGILLLIRWKQLVGELAARRGIKLDLGVYDLPRIARVPGPNNLKRNPAAPTGLVVRHEGASLRLSDVTAGLDRFVPAVEDSGLRWASGTIREARGQDGVPRIFTDEQAQAFLEEYAWRRARETPWGAGADFWKVIWECALVASCFIEMYDEDDLREGLRQAIRDGHDGADPDMNDEYQIHLGFIKGRTFSARRPTAAEQTNPFHLAFDASTVGPIRLDDRYRPGVISPAGSTDPGFKLGAPRTEVFLSDEFWESRPVFRHLRAVAQSKLASPEGVLIAGLSLAIAHTMPNLVLPACVGVEASLNLMTVICGGSGDGKSVCRKLASEALNFAGVKEPWIFNPSSGQGVAGQYQYLKKERGQPARMERSRHRALAMVEESDTIRALSANPNSTLSSELRKAAMGETLGFGNIGETQTNLPEHSYRFVMMMCMQPDLADWLLGDAAGGLPQRFVWACVRDPRVVRGVSHPGVFEIRLPIEARPSPMPALTQDGRVDVAASEKDENGKVNVFASSVGSPRSRYVMPISEAVCEEIFEAAIQRKIRGDEAGTDYDGHALLARLKIAGGIALLDGRADLRDDDWELAAHVVAASSATRDWVQQRVSDMAVRANVKAAHAKGHARVVEESVVETQAKARCANAILGHLERNPDGLPKAELKRKIKAELRHLVDEKDGVLDALLASGQVRFEDILKGDQQVGSRWFRVI